MSGHSRIFVISGVKNSGKTTLICRLLEIYSNRGLKTATIKHDGHDFDADVPGTDTYRHFHAGAYGTAIFSDEKCMVVKRQKHITEEQLIQCFPEADIILLEGFKYSPYPKIELVRRGNSAESICGGHALAAIATDLASGELKQQGIRVPLLDLNDAEAVADFILAYKI